MQRYASMDADLVAVLANVRHHAEVDRVSGGGKMRRFVVGGDDQERVGTDSKLYKGSPMPI